MPNSLGRMLLAAFAAQVYVFWWLGRMGEALEQDRLRLCGVGRRQRLEMGDFLRRERALADELKHRERRDDLEAGAVRLAGDQIRSAGDDPVALDRPRVMNSEASDIPLSLSARSPGDSELRSAILVNTR